MHDIGNSFDPLFVSPDIYGVSGINFAIVDDQVTPQAAMAGRAMSVLPGNYFKKAPPSLPSFLSVVFL